MRYDLTFIGIALVCLLGGESFGLWMGMNQDFTLEPAHAHLNLVGWVTLCLYGLAHRAFPALSTSRLALAQAIVAIVAAIVFPIGIAIAITAHNPTVAIVAGHGVILGTLMFGIMFVRHARA